MNKGQVYNPKCSLPDVCIHTDRREHDKDRHLQAEHGIDLEKYREIQEAQNSSCGICLIPQEDMEMRVDSYSERVFGLLCKNCITRISALREFEKLGLTYRAREWAFGSNITV